MKSVAIPSKTETPFTVAAKVAGGFALAALAWLALRELPSLVRYVRMETM